MEVRAEQQQQQPSSSSSSGNDEEGNHLTTSSSPPPATTNLLLESIKVKLPKVSLSSTVANTEEANNHHHQPHWLEENDIDGESTTTVEVDLDNHKENQDSDGDGGVNSDLVNVISISSNQPKKEVVSTSSTTVIYKSSCSRSNSYKLLLPRPQMDNNQMLEITQEFFESVKCLELGELLHDPTFGLFEAMSAIEMMDPKMDAGMVCNKGKRAILNFDQAFQEGVLKLDGLSFEELIGINDTTLCCLVTWLDGHSLVQTVFTNLYLHRPAAIVDKQLKATSVAALKLVDVIEECICKAGVFEEEDFQPSVYGYNLASMFTDAKTLSMLRECEDEMQKKIKQHIKGLSKSETKENDDSGNNSEDSVKELEVMNAWLSRLRFLRVFQSLMLHFWKRDNLSECLKLIATSQTYLQEMQKSVYLGVQRRTDETETFMVGFELLVNQRLLPPTFPRSTRIKTNEESFSFLDGLLQRMKTVLKVTSIQSFHGIIDFFHSFSESQPCVLSRSLLQLPGLLPGINDLMESMKEAVKTFISPPVLTNKAILTHNKEISECVEMFFERCATVFSNLLIACGHNRARQRDRLAHLMEDFANIQNETEKIDNYINTLCLQQEIRPHGNCFGTWLLCHICKLMIRYVLSGFELELYAVHEFSYIYWYLYEFLYAWLLSAYARADAYILEGETAANSDKSGKKSGKNKQKSQKTKSKAYTKELMLLQAEQNLAGGYFKVMMGLINDSRVPFPNIEFDKESVRYRHRFAPFAFIQTPAIVPYVQYKQLADMTSVQPSINLYVAAARSFHQAKQFLEAIPGTEKEVADLLKIAKTNFVVVKLLASGHTKESKTPPEFDFSSHMHFPVLKVK